jgi:exopolysaccharide biosynthesis polyprenyl glycosylphosphotransferase
MSSSASQLGSKTIAKVIPVRPEDFVRRVARSSDLPARFERVLTLFELAADFLVVFLVFQVAYWFGFALPSTIAYPFIYVIPGALACSLLFVLMLDREGAYRRGNSLLRVKETERVLRVSAQVFALLLLMSAFAGSGLPGWAFLIAAAAVPTALIVQKQVVYVGVRTLHARGYGVRNVVIYGAGDTGRRVFSALARSPKLGLRPVAIVDDYSASVGNRVFELAYRRDRSVPIESGPITKEFLQDHGAGMVVIAVPSLARDKFVSVLNAAAAADANLAFVPNHYVSFDMWIEHADIDGLLLASFRGPSERFGYTLAKRLADLVVSIVLLILCAPLWLLIALLVKLDSKGPAFFSQRRVGKNGVPFNMYKFRTMFTDAPPYSYSPLASEDPRITRLGRFLRRTSLDEIPQLLNILRGEMSLVGPRPEMPFIVDTYMPRHRQRLQVKPGITGLWQLSADRDLLIHENIEYDLYYIRNRSFFMDVAIVLHTALFFMRGI